MFKWCAPLSGPLDVATFMANLMGNFQGVVQYNDEGNPITIDLLCGMMDNNSLGSVLQRYAAISNLFLTLSAVSCLNNSYDDMIAQLNSTVSVTSGVGPRAWTVSAYAAIRLIAFAVSNVH